MRAVGTEGAPMSKANWLAVNALLLVIVLGGCARASRDTTGFALYNNADVEAPFVETWQGTKKALRDLDYDIFTRDKRGLFVAFTQMKRHWLVPRRTQYTITLAEIDTDTTAIEIETVNQVFGVTLLTYPGWHDRQAKSDGEAVAILDAIRGNVAAETTAAQ
uniref:Uncharacterized protein n=1 Tax=uncultured bacterium FLS12 TaxID=651659 RepID=C5HLB6_9BACT|nr:hypothetical protein SH0658 [uncultured bacterium FLS12]